MIRFAFAVVGAGALALGCSQERPAADASSGPGAPTHQKTATEGQSISPAATPGLSTGTSSQYGNMTALPETGTPSVTPTEPTKGSTRAAPGAGDPSGSQYHDESGNSGGKNIH